MSPWRRLVLSLSIAAHAAAVSVAAQSPEAEAIGAEWLGPRSSAASVAAARGPIWQGPGAMFVEQQRAEHVIRSWWPSTIADPAAASLIDGFARYLQAYAIEREFDRRYLRMAHSVETRRYFGGHVIWSFPPLRLSRQAVTRRDHGAAVFLALEQWIGRANLQGAMFEVAKLPANQLTANAIVQTISNAAGQDLSWILAAAAPGVRVNYAVIAMSSVEVAGCGTPCVETAVTVSRDGNGVYPGRSAGRVAEFESGDALRLTVMLADGSESSARWDGRDASRRFTFRGPSRAAAAHLDPDRIVTLDDNRLDNSIVTPAPTNAPVGKWTARWMVWLQHTMLSYGFLA